jgi:serine/threonine-protein kinase HSL1 (negative regulator of Swe1 kinase)
VAHSNSDHHHNTRHSPTRRDIQELPTHKRSQSAYSILNNEHLYSKHSLYESPASEASYDPFRASKQPIIPIPEDTPLQNVTVRRGHSNRSDKLRPTTALGHRTGSLLRIQALRNNSKRSSAAVSRGSSNRSTPSHRAIAVQRRSMSRSSLASSHWPSSPPVIVRSSGGIGRRGVSFSHLRDRRSSAATASSWQTEVASVADYMSHRPHTSIGSYGPSLRSNTIRTNNTKRSSVHAEAPRLKVRKPESPTKYIQGEARKVSMELGKVMEEAFNRSSVGSSIRSGTEIYHDVSQYDSPPTSFSNTRDSGGSTLTTTPGAKMLFGERPLPPVPSETPNTFLQRKLAETRAEIARRLNDDDDNTGHYNEVLEHLDRLMVPTVNGKRTVSAPAKSPEVGPLHVIPEERADGGDGFDPYSPHYRSVTDPLRHGRRVVTEQQQTIRIVDGSPTRIAPLNIRKRSGASLRSTAASQAPAVPWSGPTATTVRPYQDVHNEPHAARSADAVPALEKQNTVIKKKKSLWFRRNTEEKDQEQENNKENQIKKKQSNGLLQIPEAWQGLDDRTARRDDPAHLVTAIIDDTKHNQNQSEGSSGSEFPMRNSSSAGAKNDGSRKGFFGSFFSKKTKEDKGKNPMELGGKLSHIDLVIETVLTLHRP